MDREFQELLNKRSKFVDDLKLTGGEITWRNNMNYWIHYMWKSEA